VYTKETIIILTDQIWLESPMAFCNQIVAKFDTWTIIDHELRKGACLKALRYTFYKVKNGSLCHLANLGEMCASAANVEVDASVHVCDWYASMFVQISFFSKKLIILKTFNTGWQKELIYNKMARMAEKSHKTHCILIEYWR